MEVSDKIDAFEIVTFNGWVNALHEGIGSTKSSGIAPVQPILKQDKEGTRFIEHYDIADTLGNESNIAVMH